MPALRLGMAPGAARPCSEDQNMPALRLGMAPGDSECE